jgi:hypothetical protein
MSFGHVVALLLSAHSPVADAPRALPGTVWIKDPSVFAALDAKVAQVQVPPGSSVREIASALSSVSNGELEKARALFDWIASHMAYDNDAVARRYFERDPEVLATTLRSDCGGFARLFHAVGKEMGLTIHEVGGNIRSLQPPPPIFAVDTKPLAKGQWLGSHVWNTVKIGDAVGLVDCTVACTRSITNGKTTTRTSSEEFFLPEPGVFATRYIPLEPKYALVDHLATGAALADLPAVYPIAARLGFDATALRPVIGDSGPFKRLVFKGLGGPEASAQLTAEGSTVARSTLCQSVGNDLFVWIAPPEGASCLNIWWIDAKGRGRVVASYAVGSTTASPKLPAIYRIFGDSRSELAEPITGELKAGEPVTFRIRIPGADNAGLVCNDQPVVRLQRSGDWFFGRGPVPQGKVCVCAQFGGKSYWHGLLLYDVR